VGNHKLSLKKPFINDGQHLYEVIEVLSRLELTLVPVLNEEKVFLGVVTQEDLTKAFSNLSGMQHPGGIIVLEMNNNDYSLTEISNIVESNDARILSLYISSSEDQLKLRVTLKLNITDLTSILETFNRYSYNIFASYMTSENMDEFYQDRYDGFLNYLNI
jgi:acetoin utilization protein AcuB